MEADITNQIDGLQPVKERGVTPYPYILFNKSPEQLRRVGACGGRAYGRNQRARCARVPTPRPAVPPRAVPRETAAEAIHVLDAQFPWLSGAEQPVSRNPAWHPRSPAARPLA